MRTLLVATLFAMTATAEVKIEKTNWSGWPNCYRISNGTVELIVTSDVGPRIMRYAFVGGPNVFKEFTADLGKSGEKEFVLRGGHRLWAAPEDLKTSWAPDNVPAKIAVSGAVLTATQSVDSAGIQKEFVIKMAPGGGAVEVVHRLTNGNAWPIELAAWAMSMMTPGGRAITGFPPRGKHPEDLLPTNPLVLWAYTNLSDPRWGLFRKYLTLRQDPAISDPQKIGLFNADTWAAYLSGDILFAKRASADPSKKYLDFGCSFETFTNGEMLELETLGPMTRLEPGKTVEHTERWTLHRGVKVASWSDAELDRVILPLLP